MADDASFHSCCEEWQHQHHHHSQNLQPYLNNCHSWAGKCNNGGRCGRLDTDSDTDDEAQFLTASNSLEADAAVCDLGGEFGCEGGTLERTIGGEDCSRQSPMSPSDLAGPMVVASTITAEPLSERLDASSFESSDAVAGEDFPPPLASSSRMSFSGLRISGTPALNLSSEECKKEGSHCKDARDNTAALSDLNTKPTNVPDTEQQIDSCQYYQENDLMTHRPASRRTRSGPIMRQPYSTDNLLLRAGYHKHLNSNSSKSPKTDVEDFPSQLRKRVRFADALGFDLTSVVTIAARSTSSGCVECDVRELEFEFETFMIDAESELNRGRLFAESQQSQLLSPFEPPQQQQQQHPPPPLTVQQSPSDSIGWVSKIPWEPAVPSECQPVVLEFIRFDGPALELSARVLNLAPQKSLSARVTFDGWQHHADWSLRYYAEPAEFPHPGCERFRMRLYLPTSAREVELALRYCVSGYEYWDNNGGRNYIFKRR